MSAVRSFSVIDYDTAQQAAEWFALLGGDDVDDVTRRRWQDWLQARPEHAQAWQRVEQVARHFGALPVRPARQALSRAGLGRRRALKTLLVAGAGSSLLWAGARSSAWRVWSADLHTAVGEIRAETLPDGTQLWLNTSSAVDLAYHAHWRRVLLRGGEVLVQTAADSRQPARPWVLDTPQGRLRALGTRFSVRDDGDATGIAVFEGAVEIRPAAAPPQILPAGMQTHFTATAIDTPQTAQWHRQSWSSGMLVADDMRLVEFVDELSRYQHGYLGCDPAIADLRLVGAYPIADPARVLAALEATLPVAAYRPLPGWTVLRPR